MRTVYLVGIPASGKTTTLRAATEMLGWTVGAELEDPIPHIVYANLAMQIGRNRAEMAGTDALSMSIGPRAIDFVRSRPTDLLVVEGDRLAYDGFLDAAAEAGQLDVVWLDVAPRVARERALTRNPRAQNDGWVKGRISKVDNLVARRPHTRINASLPAPEVVAAVARIIDPAWRPPAPATPRQRL